MERWFVYPSRSIVAWAIVSWLLLLLILAAGDMLFSSNNMGLLLLLASTLGGLIRLVMNYHNSTKQQ